MEAQISEAVDILDYKPTPEELLRNFQQLLAELEETPAELTMRMVKMGDHRSYSTIIRSIQRMAAGDTGVSGEMVVILNLLVREQRSRLKKYAYLKWQESRDGIVSTIAGDFKIALHPKSRGRWLVHMVHKEGYSPEWPVWQNSLEAAKLKALTCLDDAIAFIESLERAV